MQLNLRITANLSKRSYAFSWKHVVFLYKSFFLVLMKVLLDLRFISVEWHLIPIDIIRIEVVNINEIFSDSLKVF